MGAAQTSARDGSCHEMQQVRKTSPVTLHCYDYFSSGEGQALNGVLRQFGTGAFHCGVEVYGKEWSFRGRSGAGSGVFVIRPKTASNSFRESVSMGMTPLSEEEVNKLVHLLMRDWPASGYDLLKRNCCHFSNELCKLLGVGSIPEWITHLANTGKSLEEDLQRLNEAFADLLQAEDFSRVPSGPPSGAGFPHAAPCWPGVVDTGARYDRLQTIDGEVGPMAGMRNHFRCEAIRPASSGGFKGCLGAMGLLFVMVAACTCLAVAVRHPTIFSRTGATQQQAAAAPPPANLQPMPRLRLSYDCDVELAVWRTKWSDDKKTWCCKHRDRGCLYNCLSHYKTFAADWSSAKRDWCCAHARLGCQSMGANSSRTTVVDTTGNSGSAGAAVAAAAGSADSSLTSMSSNGTTSGAAASSSLNSGGYYGGSVVDSTASSSGATLGTATVAPQYTQPTATDTSAAYPAVGGYSPVVPPVVPAVTAAPAVVPPLPVPVIAPVLPPVPTPPALPTPLPAVATPMPMQPTLPTSSIDSSVGSSTSTVDEGGSSSISSSISGSRTTIAISSTARQGVILPMASALLSSRQGQ
mmetsp:Transcript_55394/g.140071  ORF Transcript_55394/g.140071 Transcript_55394/m.140071 type:complete len:580 (+) Transcript_55394:107-1846(+)